MARTHAGSSSACFTRSTHAVAATADFAEAVAGMEEEWSNAAFKPENRLRGPASFLADGDLLTGWRADLGPGRRNTEAVAVAQFEQPLNLPAGTKLKVALQQDHCGDGSGYRNTMIGRFRVALTQTADPKVTSTPYAAILAMQVPAEKRTTEQKQAIFDAWRIATPAMKPFNDQIAQQWKSYPEPRTSVLHLAEPQDAILEGFTIKNGLAPLGGGIQIENASPVIKDCYIYENNAYEGLVLVTEAAYLLLVAMPHR